MSSYAQHSISGVVTDSLSNPLPNVYLRVLNTDRVVLTDFYGGYSINNLEKGDYTIEVKLIGYTPYIFQVNNLSENKEVNLTLKEANRSLNEIIVESTRASDEAPFAQNTVDYTDVEKMNLGQDLPILLDNQISMVTTSDAGAGVGYTGFRLRGSDASRINVTVNGIPINDPESQGVFWVNMPDFASSIENIQIQRGVGTSTNGAGAFGGTVNMQTSDLQSDSYGEISTSYGSFNTQKYTAKFGTGLINNRWAFDGRASAINSDGYIDRASARLRSYYLSGGYYGDKTVIKFVHFAGNEVTYQSWYGTPESRITGNVADMEAHAINNGLSEAETQNLLNSGRTYNHYLYENEVDNYGQDHYQFHLSHKFNKYLNGTMALHYTYGSGYFEQYRQDDDFSDYGLGNLIIGSDTITSTDLIRRRWLDNHFYGVTYNLRYQKNKLNVVLGGAYNQYDGDHFGEIIWSEFANGTEIRDRYYDNNGFKTDFNTYLKADYKFTDQLIGFADIQVRNVTYTTKGIDSDLRTLNVDTTFFFINPKAGLTFRMNPNNMIYASVSVANREPVRNDFIDNPANEQPKHEQMIDYELGWNWKTKKTSFQANAYYMDYKNQLILTGALNDVGSSIRTNVPDSYRMGIELAGSVAITRQLNLNANATLSQNKIAEYTHIVYDYTTGFDVIETVYENTDIAFSPSVIAAAGLEYNPFKSFNVLLQSKYVGRQYLDNTSNVDKSLDPYHTLNARVSYTLFMKKMKSISFNVLVNNVLNTMYSSNGYTFSYIYGETITENFYYPQAGINMLGGITFKF